VRPSWSGAVPPGDLAAVRPNAPPGAHRSRLARGLTTVTIGVRATACGVSRRVLSR